MDQDVKRIIEMIDAKVRTLQQTKRVLLSEFGDQKESGAEIATLPLLKDVPMEVAKSETRRETVKRVIREHGPMKTSDLQKASGIPRGSLNWVLREKDVFTRLDNGRWELVENKKNKGPYSNQ